MRLTWRGIVPAVCAALLVLGSIGAGAGRPAEAAEVRNADDLLIVDCLLPGQVRRLGTEATYVTARRAVKTTAADCALRGGEYTAYDRASFATSLQIWLPLAQEGDPEAQTHVGEIFEKGLGVPPQYDLAAQWYELAAEAGFARAQLNLGSLYERGLGVPKDPAKAVEWYRRASGLESAGIPYVPAEVNAEIESLRAERDRLAEEREVLRRDQARLEEQLEAVRRQLEEAEEELRRRQTDAEAARAALEAARRDLEREREAAVAAGDESRAEELAEALAEKRYAVERRDAEIESLRAEVGRLSGRAGALEQALAKEAAGRAEEVAAARAEADEAKAALERVSERLAETEAELARQFEAAATTRSEVKRLREEIERQRALEQRDDAAIGELAEKLAAREAELAANRARVGELNDMVAGLERDAGELRRLEAEAAEADRAAEAAPPVITLLDPELPSVRAAGDATVRISAVSQRLIVGRVEAGDAIVALTVNDRALEVSDEGVFRADIAVTAPETEVEVVAVDRQGRRASLAFKLVPEPAPGVARGASDGEAVPFMLPADLEIGRYHALVIGNNDYAMLPDLESAVRDARAVEDMLRTRYGFETTLLIDADRYAILSALNELRETLTDEDNLLIYYAGHGELDRINNRGHWLPVDAEPTSTANWISNIQITDVLNAMSARQVLVVADSCYSGTLTRAAVAQLDAGMSPEARLEWLKVIASKRARVVLSSGGVQPVLDSGGGDHSVFARAFLEALEQNARVLEAQRLSRVVAEAVTGTAAAASLGQLPQYAPIQYAGHEAGDFLFVPVNAQRG